MEPRKLADHYSYRVDWSEEDEVFVARVREWPSIAAHGRTKTDALDECVEAVVFAVEDCLADGDEFPHPANLREYSGRFNIRIPPELHRELALAAAEQDVSLNQFVTVALARQVK